MLLLASAHLPEKNKTNDIIVPTLPPPMTNQQSKNWIAGSFVSAAAAATITSYFRVDGLIAVVSCHCLLPHTQYYYLIPPRKAKIEQTNHKQTRSSRGNSTTDINRRASRVAGSCAE